VNDLQPVPKDTLHELEPALAPGIALLSPSSGIIDSHAYMQSLLQQAEKGGLIFSPMTDAVSIARHPRGYSVESLCQDSPYPFTCENLINAAGLWAQQVAAGIVDFPAGKIPEQVLVKGNYFSLQGKSPFRHLIYPVPEPDLKGLGVHVTLDMAGQARFGPDTEAVTTLDYDVDTAREVMFRNAISRYFPAIDRHNLTPAYSGIRPKLVSNKGVADFVIQWGVDFGFAGLIQLFGIESPGLTASLAIADQVVNSFLA
jgi:L-2-hydroxyglutarate oxidase LhgO